MTYTEKKNFMEQLNRIELRGIVGNVRQMSYPDSLLTRFSLVTNYAYKDRDGNAVIEPSWHNVTAWNGKYIPDLSAMEKGDRVYVVGRLRYQKVTAADGTDRYYTEILATKVEVLPDSDTLQYEML